ncbi:MAG: GNAT family N-acetyltransferase [Dehalococcoidia bacterium]|jgi:GNAT superfamily N-acetyltransferase|nr:GNAT family N-acetyltransferase [Dehalococcoidia bacterium]
MTEGDISDVLAIDRALVENKRVLTYADPAESYIGDNLAANWVAETDNTVVGFALCWVVEPGLGTIGGAWMELLGVDPAAHSKGVGKATVTHLRDYCSRRSE